MANTPYLIGSAGAASGSGTRLTVPITNSVASLDTIQIAVGVSSASVTVAVSDSAGNSYGQILVDTTLADAQMYVFESDGSNPLVAGTDHIFVDYSTNASRQVAIAVGDNNTTGADKTVIAHGTSTLPSSGSSGTLSQTEEHCIGFIVNASAGGTPSAWTGTTTVLGSTSGGSSTPTFISAAYTVVTATTAKTAGATIVSADWSCAIVTNRVAPVTPTLLMAGGVQNESYSQTLEASGGNTPYTWSISSGSLPTGLTLASGVVSGTPTVTGTFTFTTRATDVNGVTGDLVQTINIVPGVAAGAPAMSLANNLLTPADSDAETGSITWAASVNANTPAVTTHMALTGAKSISWSATADGDTQIATGFYNVQPSQNYIGSGFIMPAAARDCFVGVAWYTSGNTLIRTDLGVDNPSSGNSWQPMSFRAFSPSNAAKAKIVYLVQAANKGEVTHIDLNHFTQSDAQVLIDWFNPTFAAGSSAGQDFMDVSPWIKFDQGLSMTHGRQDALSDVQAGSVSFQLQNDDGTFTRRKSTSLVSVLGGAITVQRRYQIAIADENGVWNIRADGPVAEGGYTFTNNGGVSVLQVTGTDVLAFLSRQDSMACWTKEQVLSDNPQYHWSLNDSGNAGGSGIVAETSGNNGPSMRTWNSDNTKTATIGFQDSSGGVETLADAVAPGQPDGGEFWSPGSNQPTSVLRGLDSGAVGPYSSPMGSVYLTPKLTAQASFNQFIGNIGYQLQASLPSFIDPSQSSYTFEMWFTMDPGIKTNIATKFGPYVPLSLGSSIDGTNMVAGIFLNGSSPHTMKVNTYGQPPAFQAKNFSGAAIPATIQSVSQNLPADNVQIPHHLVITIGQGSPAVATAYLDGVPFGTGSFNLPAGQRYDTICIGGAYGGMGCHWGGVSLVSMYMTALDQGTILTHAQLGQYGTWEQTTDDCIAQIASYSNAPGFWLNVSGKHTGLTLSEYQDITGNNPLTAMQTFEKAEGGLLFVDATGALNFRTRDFRMGHGAPDLLLPPDTYSADMSYELIDQFMTNEMGVATQVFQTGASFVNTASQQAYGVYSQNSINSPLQLPLITWSRAFGALGLTSFYYFSDPNLDDRAAWEVNSHAEPWLTPAQLQVDLLTLNKTSTGLGISNFYALEVGSMVAPSGSLPASFPDANISREWFVEGMVEFYSSNSHTISFYCSPAETQRAWIPGDSTYGVLGSTSRIGISAADIGPEAADGKDVSHDGGRPYWAPNFAVGMNNPAGGNNGFIGALDIRGLTDNLNLLLNPPMLVVSTSSQAQTMPTGSNSTPQIFWDTVYVDTEGGMGLAPGWPNWYVVTVPGYYDIDANLVWALGGANAGTAAQGWIVVAQAAAQGLAAGTSTPVTAGKYVCPIGESVRVNAVSFNNMDAPTTRLYLGLGDMVTLAGEQSTGGNRATGSNYNGCHLSMVWRGWNQKDDRVQINSAITGGTVATNPTTTTFTKVYPNTHSYSYYGTSQNYNRANFDGNIYQGTYSGGRSVTGSRCSQVVFDHNQINADLTVAGTVAIKSVTLNCRNIHTWYNSGGKLMLGYSTQTPGGSSFDAHGVANRDVFEESFSEGQQKTFTLPSSFASTFQGAGKFFLVGDSRTEDLNKYGYWQGGPGAWSLVISYTVTV